jgi:hypothetical protein
MYGRPYDPFNLSWLIGWALNGEIPPAAQRKEAAREVRGAAVTEKVERFMNKR